MSRLCQLLIVIALLAGGIVLGRPSSVKANPQSGLHHGMYVSPGWACSYSCLLKGHWEAVYDCGNGYCQCEN